MRSFISEESKDKVLNYYDMLLEKISVKYSKLNIQSRFGDTFCIAAGEDTAPSIIFLHSGNMNSAMWVEYISSFSKHFRVYALDMPGEPGKSIDNRLSYDTDDYIEWLSDVLDFLYIKNTMLIGSSLGAFVAAKFSSQKPEKISKLVLISPLGIVHDENKFKDIAISIFPKLEEGIDNVLEFINEGNPLPDVILNYQKFIEARINQRKQEVPLFTDEDLKKLTMPCILFLEEGDSNINVYELRDRFKALVKECEVVLIKNQNHSLDDVSDDLLKFLQK